MSYDIEIVDPVTEEVLHTPDESSHYIRGGTYAVNGTSEMWINITYNYSSIISKAFNNELGIKYLENKSASDAIPILTKFLIILFSFLNHIFKYVRGDLHINFSRVILF